MTDKQSPKAPIKVDLKKISAKNKKLSNAAKTLKSTFIGIDNVIDELIDTLRIWYLMPEVLTRPVVINLWGMTGVGKTDLIRRLVSALDFQDRFVEVELNNGDKTSWYNSVDSVLSNNALNDTEPKIILFDEIQRFNTLDEEGKPITNTKFSDFWELLSDGRLSRREREDIDFLLSEIIHSNREVKRRKNRGEEDIDNTVDIYESKQIKKILNLDKELHEIAQMPRTKLIELLYQAKEEKQVFEPINHSKSLIIICGNLDDAFSMANQTAESDVDADIFNAFTKKVTIVDVKEALSRRFKPEQVARFGNIHVIYRSLRREHFETLIHREVSRVIKSTQKNFGIRLSVSDAIHQIIYRNGVFPVQGVRPVFSTVNDVLENNVARFVYEALIKKVTRIELDYDEKAQALVATLKPHKGKKITLHRPYVGRLDKIRQQSKADVVANVSVHESGHAVMYGVFFNLAPLQLTSRVASSLVSGFTFPHDIHGTRQNIISQIMVYLAGGIAEDIIFGPNKASIGRLSDREEATKLALDYVRRYGFDDEFQSNYTLEYEYKMDLIVTDVDVEKMMTRLAGETHNILLQHISLLLALSSALAEKGELDGSEVSELATQHNLELITQKEGYLHLPAYAELLDEATQEDKLKR